MIDVRFRPMPIWAYPSNAGHRASGYHFKASWQNTLNLMERELGHLSARNIVIGVGLSPAHIRNDGWPRSDAPRPLHPGVELSFEAYVGGAWKRLVYATDVYPSYQHNLRAIALALEALRAVDRHGVTGKGQQYAGFAALPPGGPSAERGAQKIRESGSLKKALFATHPDHGGNELDFADVQAAKEAGLA